ERLRSRSSRQNSASLGPWRRTRISCSRRSSSRFGHAEEDWDHEAHGRGVSQFYNSVLCARECVQGSSTGAARANARAAFLSHQVAGSIGDFARRKEIAPTLYRAPLLGSVERSLRSASASVRLAQCGAAAGVGAVDIGLPGPLDGPANLTRLSAKRKSLPSICTHLSTRRSPSSNRPAFAFPGRDPPSARIIMSARYSCANSATARPCARRRTLRSKSKSLIGTAASAWPGKLGPRV